jgi:hypothetical protein
MVLCVIIVLIATFNNETLCLIIRDELEVQMYMEEICM